LRVDPSVKKAHGAVEVDIDAIVSADATASAATPPVDQAGPTPAAAGHNETGGHIDLPLPDAVDAPGKLLVAHGTTPLCSLRVSLRTYQECNTNIIKSACAT
jgi:hypothetical protein